MTKNLQTDEMPVFEREYFIQTRREIDTEKHERDRLLHFAILLFGGVTAVLFQREDFLSFILSPESIFVEVALLTILTSMFWIRWKKLCQIADRWYVLFQLLNKYLDGKLSELLLEKIVINGFNKKRYVCKDVVLNYSLCLPIYLIMVDASVRRFLEKNVGWAILSIVVVVVHIFLSYRLLSQPVAPNLNE